MSRRRIPEKTLIVYPVGKLAQGGSYGTDCSFFHVNCRSMKSRITINKAASPTHTRVYSTDVGRTCPGCLRAQALCICKSVHNTLQATDASDGIVRLHRERKGRKGKGVTVVKRLALAESELAALAKALKSGCAVGGSVKHGTIELQTLDRDKIKRLLEGRGYDVKIAGG